MTVYVDATALVALHTNTAAADVVERALRSDQRWATSAATLPEALALVDRVVDGAVRDDLEDLVRLTWDRLAFVPVDGDCLQLATVLMRTHPLSLANAVHLAAARRLAPPVTLVTLDPAQIPVAIGLGFDVVSP